MEHFDNANVDPAILKKLSAQVTHFHGPRKNLSFVISVEALGANRHISSASSAASTSSSASSSASSSKDRDSSQFVARSFEEFRRFRKSLLLRIDGYSESPAASLFSRSATNHARCSCQGEKGCAFDATRAFIERMRFTRMPFFSLGFSEADIASRQTEMNNFLRMIFTIVHRMHPSAWQSNCLFLQDILTFLDVEQAFFEQVEDYLKKKSRPLTLGGWKAHTAESFGHGIRTKQT